MKPELQCHYVSIIRDDAGNEIDRGREIFDRAELFDALPDAIASTNEILFGFDPDDVRTWCRVELLMSVWQRTEGRRHVVLTTPFWSSVDVAGNIGAVDRLLLALSDTLDEDALRPSLLKLQDQAARMLRPYLRIV